MYRNEDVPDGPMHKKFWKLWPCPQMCCKCNLACRCCRKLVSRSKVRYETDSFDLDLVYASPDNRIITHGFPAAGIEHFFRNPRYEMVRFFDRYHKNHYKVYNLCCEPGRGYAPEVFHGRVERYPFRDHCVPSLECMFEFANSVKAWVEADPKNVVTVHCKAGKGRSGVMTCIAMLRLGHFDTAKAAIDHYDSVRVTNSKGLTVPSQRKYVHIFEQLWRDHLKVEGNIGDKPAEEVPYSLYQLPRQPQVSIKAVRVKKSGFKVDNRFVCKVNQGTPLGAECMETCYPQGSSSTYADGVDIEWHLNARVRGNFCVIVNCSKASFSCKAKKFFNVWQNTWLLGSENSTHSFRLDELDCKKKIKKRVSPDMIVEVEFEIITDETALTTSSSPGSECLLQDDAINLEMTSIGNSANL